MVDALMIFDGKNVFSIKPFCFWHCSKSFSFVVVCLKVISQFVKCRNKASLRAFLAISPGAESDLHSLQIFHVCF